MTPAAWMLVVVGLILLARQGNPPPGSPPAVAAPIPAQPSPSTPPPEAEAVPAPPPACTLTTDKTAYCTGDTLQAQLAGPPATTFEVQARYVGIWVTASTVVTGADGTYAAALPLDAPDTYIVRATSAVCTTATLDLIVADCGGG